MPSSKRPSPTSPPSPKRPRALTTYVHLPRPASLSAARQALPVCAYEQEIVEAVRANGVVIVTGATGSGKTTQVPQFLLEAAFGAPSSTTPGAVAVTQPRRVAAIACAGRVAEEVGGGHLVGFHVRHRAARGSRLTFCTDGVLLAEVQDDLLLSKYSCVVVDEAHERTLNTDLLLALLSRTVVLRAREPGTGAGGVVLDAFKLIVMSATLDMDGVFTGPGSLFPGAPVVNVPARQYPVAVHFARRTQDDYVAEAVRKVRQIHAKLPAGGVLVFLTGRQEVDDVCGRLGEGLPEGEVAILPLYAVLDDRRQRQVFRDFGEKRKIVVATNVAETSVTIPGITYVVDSGRAKEKVYRGGGSGAMLSSFEIVWISKASSEQRAGRSGRTGPGHCYRLYSSAIYNDHFDKFRVAEIRRIPADAVVLRLRSMGIRHIDRFPFPTAPDKAAIHAAELLLKLLGALEPGSSDGKADARGSVLGVTPVGLILAKLPAPPRFGRMLLAASAVPGCLPYAARAAAILSLGDVLAFGDSDAKRKHAAFVHPASDILTSVRALCAVEHTGTVASQEAARNGASKSGVRAAAERAMKELCDAYSLNFKTCAEALNVAQQLETAVERAVAGKNVESVDGEEEEGEREDTASIGDTPAEASSSARKLDAFNVLAPMTEDVENGLIRSFLCGFPDQVARRMTIREAGEAGVIPRRRKIAFTTANSGTSEEPVFLGSFGSVVLEEEHEFVCYAEVVEVSRRDKKDPAHAGSDGDDYDESDDDVVDVGESNGAEGNDEGLARRVKGGIEVAEDGVAIAASGGAAVSSRRILRGVSCVQCRWLQVDARSMCSITVAPPSSSASSVKSASNGLYDPRTDRVVRIARARYGRRGWALGSMPVSWDFDDGLNAADAASIFAAALVHGVVVKGLGCEKGAASASSGRVATLGRVLLERRVMCKSDFLRTLRSAGKDFARPEFTACFGQSVRAIVLQKWDTLASMAAEGVIKDST